MAGGGRWPASGRQKPFYNRMCRGNGVGSAGGDNGFAFLVKNNKRLVIPEVNQLVLVEGVIPCRVRVSRSHREDEGSRAGGIGVGGG